MREAPPLPRDMSEVCRLCLSSDEEKLPIFGEDQASLHRTPLPFRILACVSVEVSSQDVLPTVICKVCLQQVNQWHDFKQVCDSSQATLKEWLCQTRAISFATTTPTTTNTITNTDIITDQVVIKQEPVDVDVDEDSVFQEDVQDVCSDSREYCMLDVKQEEIEVCEENPVEAHDILVTVDPLDVPASRSSKSSVQEEQNFYTSAALGDGNSSSFECENGEIDFMRVNHGGAISVQGLFDSGESIALGKKPVQPKKKRRFFKRITFKKKKKKSPPIWIPQDVQVETDHSHVCRKCGESFPELWLLKSHERSHGNAENVCTICEKRFSSKGCLVRHIRLHTLQMPYSCPKCSTSFANKSAYLQHRQTSCPIEDPLPASPETNQTSPEKQENKHSCYICQETFPSLNQLIQHRKGHVNYSCPKCKKHFTGGKALSNHLRIHKLGAMMAHKMVHSKAPAPPKVLPLPVVNKSANCTVCNKVFPSVGLMHRHMVKHTKLKQFQCHICHASMGYATSLHKHMKTMHKVNIDFASIKPSDSPSHNSSSEEQNPSSHVVKSEILETAVETAEENHTCTICNKVFNQKSLLVSHVKIIHMGVKAYKCTSCGKMFASKPHLVKHMQSHKEGEVALTCKICCKNFPDLKTYNKHKGVHTRYRCYTCGICSQSFNGINSWRAHQATHLPNLGHAPMMNIAKPEIRTTGGKYTCRLCFKMYRSRAELYEHKKMHIKLKIYSCTECKNSYNSLSTLMKHKRREHPNDEQYFEMGLMSADTHNCEFCGKSFSSSSSLSKHKLVHAELLYTNVTRVDPPNRRRIFKTSETQESASPLTPSDPFLCVPCNRSFTDEQSLKTHRGWHKRKRASSSFSTQSSSKTIVNSPNKEAVNSPSKEAVNSPSKEAVNSPSKETVNSLSKEAVNSPSKEAVNTPNSVKKIPPNESFWCVECNRGFKRSVNLARHFKLSQKHNMKEQSLAGSVSGSPFKDGSEGMPVEVQLLEGEQIDNAESESTADGASVDSVINDTLALENNSIAGDTSVDDDSTMNNKHAEDSLTSTVPRSVTLLDNAATVNGFVDSGSTDNCSADNASADNFFVDGAPASSCSVGDRPSEQVKSIICLDDTPDGSCVEETQVETVQENGTKTSNSSKIASSRAKQVFECHVCNKVFKSNIALVRHKGWHSRSPTSRLKSSNLAHVPKSISPFNSSVATDLHLPTLTPPALPKLYTCLTCDSSFSSASSLSKHKRLHLSPTPTVPVNRCLRPKESVRPPERMLPELEVPGAFKCSTCKKFYSSAKSLYKHQKLHARKPLPAFTKLPPGVQPDNITPGLSKRLIPTKFHCNTCGLYYSSAETLYKHKRLHERHLNVLRMEETAVTPLVLEQETPKPVGRKISGKFRCEFCLKFYSCSSNLHRHRRLHITKQLLIVDPPKETATAFPQQNTNAPTSTEQCETRQIQTSYQCDVCKKYYSSLASLNKHRRLHAARPLSIPVKEAAGDAQLPEEASRSISCPFCSKTFLKQRNLNIHIRCHTGERPYTCDLCPQAFTRYNALWKHKKRAHLNWTYTCTTCGRVFPFKNVLDLHVRKVHQAEPKKVFHFGGASVKKAKVSGMGHYPCGECKKTFVYLGALLTHKRMYHGK